MWNKHISDMTTKSRPYSKLKEDSILHHWRVLLDLDGTVAQNAGRQVAARHFGIEIPDNTSVMEVLGLTEEQFWAWWADNQEEIYDKAVVMPGAAEAVRQLKDAGAFIAVVTARRLEAEAVTLGWLSRHGIPYDTAIFAQDEKVTAARELALNIGFEDDPAFALPLAEFMPMILVENHKNRKQAIDHPHVHRVAGWHEVHPLLRRLAERSA